MNSDTVTTPFGRRGVSYAQLAHQFASQRINTEHSIDKWKLFRRICEARTVLGVSDRSLAVLNALLSFYPKTELSDEHGLVVFPSNDQLSLRAHGMSEQTLRRHLAALVDAGLILRKDSPNGKRYARKNRAAVSAMLSGFSLAPLIARSDEIEPLRTCWPRSAFSSSACVKRSACAGVTLSNSSNFLPTAPTKIDWMSFTHVKSSSLQRWIARQRHRSSTFILDELSEIRNDIAKLLEKKLEIEKISANAYQNERLIQSSESESYFEDGSPVENANTPEAEMAEAHPLAINANQSSKSEGILSEEKYDLQTVLRACPEIAVYGPNGTVRSWMDLKTAANVVKSMLSISQSAYDEAERQVGPQATSAIIACILERSGQINSAGGYLRSLIKKKHTNSFTVKPMLMALLRSKMSANIAPASLRC